MAETAGWDLRRWRESRGWDVSRLARELRQAARESGQDVAVHAGLVKMIPRWEKGDRVPRERYRLLYERLGYRPSGDGISPVPAADLDDSAVAGQVAANKEQIARIREYLASARAGGRAEAITARVADLPGEDEIRRRARDPDAAVATLREIVRLSNQLLGLLAEGGDDDDQ